jgi:hypothetical protein
MDVLHAHVGRAGAHGFVEMGVNEDRRRHRRSCVNLRGPYRKLSWSRGPSSKGDP